MKYALLVIAFFLSCFFVRAQTSTKVNLDSTVTYKGTIFKVYNNWLNLGGGIAQTIKSATSFTNVGAAYNFHIKKEYFKIGFNGSGEVIYISKSNYALNDFHVCYGKRLETFRNNFALFGGLSKLKGYQIIANKDDETYNTIGIYAEVQAVQKLTYDVGIGATLFANYNTDLAYFGMRIDLYFSNALKKGQKR